MIENQINFPVYKCWLIIGGVHGLVIRLEHTPNKFHRIMNKIFFGFEYKIL